MGPTVPSIPSNLSPHEEVTLPAAEVLLVQRVRVGFRERRGLHGGGSLGGWTRPPPLRPHAVCLPSRLPALRTALFLFFLPVVNWNFMGPLFKETAEER